MRQWQIIWIFQPGTLFWLPMFIGPVQNWESEPWVSFLDFLFKTKANRRESILLTCVNVMEKLLKSIVWICGSLTSSSQGQPQMTWHSGTLVSHNFLSPTSILLNPSHYNEQYPIRLLWWVTDSCKPYFTLKCILGQIGCNRKKHELWCPDHLWCEKYWIFSWLTTFPSPRNCSTLLSSSLKFEPWHLFLHTLDITTGFC